MSYNLPPPGDHPADGGPGLGPGGLGGFGGPGFGGFGFPGFGFGKNFNFDVGGGFGFPGFGGFGGPGGFGGGWAPYVPVTPLGGLWGFKGDLIVPIVAIGVAIFILLLIVLAVKYALAWKLQVLDDLGGAKRWKREAGQAPAEHLQDSNLNRLADIVSAAIYSEGCSRRILCEIGSYAREGKQYPSLIRLLELVVPEEYHESFLIVRQSAEGAFTCAEQYPCGAQDWQGRSQAQNEIDVTGSGAGKFGNNQTATPTGPGGSSSTSANNNATTSTNNIIPPPVTPAPSVFGKFKRAVFK